MKTANFLASSCRYCRYYQSEGRRGGMCQQLGVPVQGQWKACSLATHPFTSAWENLEDVVRLENSLNLNCPEQANSTPVVKHPTMAETKQEATV
ncbi:hypothetical protein C7H19_14195 [Aphanothece hegewaldii CCALA 016]|uniref:Uncharacterized protein n=1 Tax=Aphanothece hegewaldii CCALA 016 TaxID=2107694 RepID=A0A2T1LW65_9CHRO|nr:hypothetical protein [Aphanothece hegewaldii]PSF36145.1 hypothetical protein C7H19_14195 [Aphanothece hegewaldii CCALA 016]